MTHVRTVMLLSFCVSLSISVPSSVEALGSQPLSPQAAKQYAFDSEKAANGDPDAAFRMGETFESGRLGGVKDLKRALSFYKLAAQNGHRDAATRAAQIESQLSQSTKPESSPVSRAH